MQKSALKQKAFTLAEVLITLTIIGVVAAMTIPNLVNNAQEHSFRSAFLKNYSVVKNAYAQSIHDGMPFWDPDEYSYNINNAYVKTPKLIKNYFNIVKGPYYAGGGLAYQTFYKFYPELNKNQSYQNVRNFFKLLNGQPSSTSGFIQNGSALTFQLKDGTIVSLLFWNSTVKLVFIDVNGAKGPNTFGKDIYFLSAYRLNKIKWQYELVPLGTPGGHDNSTYESTCKLNSSGYSCAYEIVKNRGFKIPKE